MWYELKLASMLSQHSRLHPDPLKTVREWVLNFKLSGAPVTFNGAQGRWNQYKAIEFCDVYYQTKLKDVQLDLYKDHLNVHTEMKSVHNLPKSY